MSEQTTAALIAEYLDARKNRDYDRVTAITLAAIDHDRANPFGPRLMDEIRGLNQLAAA